MHFPGLLGPGLVWFPEIMYIQPSEMRRERGCGRCAAPVSTVQEKTVHKSPSPPFLFPVGPRRFWHTTQKPAGTCTAATLEANLAAVDVTAGCFCGKGGLGYLWAVFSCTKETTATQRPPPFPAVSWTSVAGRAGLS